MKNKLIGLIVLLFVKSSIAQDTTHLALQDALHAAIHDNKEVLVARLDQESAVAKLNQMNAVFQPQINLSYTGMQSNNPMNAFGFKLQQQSISPADFNPDLLNNPSATQNFVTKAELNQPLINLDMIYQRRAAAQQVDVYAYKTRRTKEYLLFEVQKGYAQLQLSYQAIDVIKESLMTARSTFDDAERRFEKGFLQKSDVLQVQVQVSTVETKLAEAVSNIENASDYLSLLMGKPSGTIYRVELMEKDIRTESIETTVPDDRADFKAMTAALSAQKIMINSSKMSHLPKLNAFANYMLNDKNAFGFGSNSYFVGAQFSWNVFNGNTLRYKIAENKIDYEKLEHQLRYQKDQSQLELNKTFRQLQDTQFSLKQQEISVSQAAEALRILQNRFQQGLVSTNDVMQTQTLLAQQKLNYAQSVFQFNVTLAYIHFLTSTSEN